MLPTFPGIFVFCLLSWVFHTAYYKYYGHPWADINGPDITTNSMTVRCLCLNKRYFGILTIYFRYHYKGTERACTMFCGLCDYCGQGASRRGLCWIRNGSEDDQERESETIESEMLEEFPVEIMTNSLKCKRREVKSTAT